jgi:tetraacyldisaccharide 4'-kinase
MVDRRRSLAELWFRQPLSPRLWPLLPVACVFAALVALRRWAYRWRLLPSRAFDVPVVVVGNITVGGAGKTPLVSWLVAALAALGRRPGIVSRGYFGDGQVREVTTAADVREAGDEPLLLARRTGLPVFVGRDRVEAVAALLAAYPDVDVVVCDDGLQHYRLRRDVEIAVLDARGFGNGWRLPAGPLREGVGRLRQVEALVLNGDGELPRGLAPASFRMALDGDRFVALNDVDTYCAASALQGRKLYAIAGIGDPPRFFAQLHRLGLTPVTRAFPDHHPYVAADLDFARDGVLLMTEKDAVKCAGLFAGEAWWLPVTARVEPDLARLVLEKIHGRKTA